MKDEIKEILEHIEILDNTDYILHSDKAKALLDYIINLEQENEKLKKQYIKLYKKDIKEINKLKLKQTKEVFDKLAYLINTNETCSYRFLIYDLLGFQKKDYIDLISGLVITNMLVDYQDYKSRNEKAINDMQEYINKQYRDTSDIDISIVNFWIDLLQGSDKDE